MEFLKFSVDGIEYGRGTTEIGRAAALRNGVELFDDRPEGWTSSIEGFNFYDERILNRKWRNESCTNNIRVFFTLLAVCHTVIPEADKKDPSKLVYQAASPDEGALVSAAANLGFKFVSRTPTSCTIDADGREETYEVLNILEFNSTRKRMSVIVKTPDKRIVLMTKGADNVIYKLIKSNKFADKTLVNLKKFAEEGLRTLVCAQVELEQGFYNKWNRDVFEKANTSLVNKEDAVTQAAEMVEKNLDLVGATAIEDKLQDGVPGTISELAKAGIKIWVLTGDKQETAINIGFACALLDNEMGIITLNDTNRRELKKKIRHQLELAKNGMIKNKSGLAVVIDGASLELVLQKRDKKKKPRTKEHAHEPTLEEKKQAGSSPKTADSQSSDDSIDIDLEGEETLAMTFLKLCMYCKSVVCCRVSPLQKALVVKIVKDNLKGAVTLAIGDGANDVSMIQAAHIGVGISGQEGLQAARASDYAIGQFRFLKKLLLVHGRYNYRRIARLICYSFYKNLTLQLCQFWFVFFNAFTGTSVYDSLLLTLFNIIFTSLPVVVFALFDRDISVKSSMKLPQLYILGQNSHYFNIRVFVGWVLNSFWHSLCCFFIPMLSIMSAIFYMGIPSDFVNLSYLVYTAVIIIVSLKVACESASMTPLQYLSIYGSILSWFVIAVIYAVAYYAVNWANSKAVPYIDLATTFGGSFFEFYHSAGNFTFWFAILLTVVVALMRDFLWKALVHNIRLGGYFSAWMRQPYHVIQDMERWNEEIIEENLQLRCKELFELKPPQRKLPDCDYLSAPGSPSEIELSDTDATPSSSSTNKIKVPPLAGDHTGYSFSQTEGGQAEYILGSSGRKAIKSPLPNSPTGKRKISQPSTVNDDDIDIGSLDDESIFSLQSGRSE
jgi:magnesium-transporting ATPase (P-type)